MTQVRTEVWTSAVGAQRGGHLTIEEEMRWGFAGCIGVHWMEISRNYSRKKDNLGRSEYSCLQSKNSVGLGYGT